jgi:hypothetical protein
MSISHAPKEETKRSLSPPIKVSATKSSSPSLAKPLSPESRKLVMEIKEEALKIDP